MMRAVRFDRFGDYAELKLVSLPRPEPGPGELLVRVLVAAVNPIDSTVRSGRFPGAKSPPLVPGQEACGVVVSGAPSLPKGTRVLVRGGLGTVRDGTWAEFVTVRAEHALRAPQGLDDASVGAAGSGFLAAALAFERGGFSAGANVLVLGVGGAVGNAAYQLARARGAGTVIGTVGSWEKAGIAAKHGLENVIDLSSESLEDGVARFTSGKGVNLVIDSVGGSVTGGALKTLADDGTLVALGYVAGPLAEINLQDLVRRRGRIQAVGLARMPADIVHALFESMREGFERGSLKPAVARTLRLDEAAEAQRFLDHDRPFGKVLLQIDGAAATP